MKECYHAEVSFSDPVFSDLKNEEVGAMWHMLCENAQDFSLHYTDIKTDGDQGSCRWDVWYTFSRSGRKVHNIINARFEFKEGLIIRHKDEFNFWLWSKMAMGITGKLLGWSPYLKSKVRAAASKSLLKFMREQHRYAL